jgi:hypothetical protein
MPGKTPDRISDFILELSAWAEKRQFCRINEHYGRMIEIDAKIKTVEYLFKKGLLNEDLETILRDMVKMEDPRIEGIDLEF